MPAAAILDVDGTLVDSNYQHAVAWYRAFRQQGIVLPVWRIHRHVGMGSDHLIAALCDEEVEERLGDEVRAAEKALYKDMIEEIEPVEGARDLVEALKEHDLRVVLASSGKEDEVEHYVDLIGVRELADGWTTSADVERTKPEPDLIEAAIEIAGDGDAVMVGDSTWDCRAAARAGLVSVGVLTGGFGKAELEEAGAAVVFDSLTALRDGLDDTPLGSSGSGRRSQDRPVSHRS